MSMLKVMIVDDEILTRIGMRSIIPWEEYGLQVVGEAEDGEQALGLAKEIVPDIVLADIMMPKMEEDQRQKNLEKNIKKEWLEPIEDKDENK